MAKLKVICILQNAWGSDTLPYVFTPNPLNKSAKTIRNKVLEPADIMHFCNTTSIVTPTAAGKAKTDRMHFQKVIQRLQSYDLILVCGTQAAEAVQYEIANINQLNKPVVFMPHPASRTLSNIQLASVKAEVDKHR